MDAWPITLATSWRNSFDGRAAAAYWQVLARTNRGVTIALLRCDGGEEADRFTSDDPLLLRFVDGRAWDLTRRLPALISLSMLAACHTTAEGPLSITNAPATAASTSVAAPTTPATTTPAATTKKWVELDVGDCLVDPPPTDPSVVTVNIVDCASPHQAEVYSRKPLALNSALADVANSECAEAFSEYTATPVGGSPFTMTFLIDSNQDRTSDNPDPSTVICLLGSADGQPITQSARH